MKSMSNRRFLLSVFTVIALLIFIAFLILTKPDNTKMAEKASAELTAIQSASTTIQTAAASTAVQTTETSTDVQPTAAVTTPVTNIAPINLPPCRSAILYCTEDQSYLYSDNIYAEIAPASLTKLLTASVALKYSNPDTVCTVGSEQSLVQPYSSLCGFSVGDTLTLGELITGMLMASGNDAAYTVAVSVAREMLPDADMSDYEAVEFFCGLMNVLAHDIGMENSNFVNPDGWDDTEHYTTVVDLVKLTDYALTLPEISDAVQTLHKDTYLISGGMQSWTNSNQLLNPSSQYYSEYAVGVKTGTTLNAGNSLIAAFKISGKTYISVVAGCNTNNDRYALTTQLISSIT